MNKVGCSLILALATSLPLWAAAPSCGRDSVPLVVQFARNAKKPFDPAGSGFAQISFYDAVLGKLLKVNESLTFDSGLLEKFFWDFERKEYVLVIREGLRFHNGREVVAEDLDFSLTRFFLSKGRVDQIALLKNIEGIAALKGKKVYRPWRVKGLRKLDRRSVGVKLSGPNPAFLFSLAESWISLVPREALQPDYMQWKSLPVGAGPYRVLWSDPESSRVRLCRLDSSPADGSLPQEIDFVAEAQIDAKVDLAGFMSENPAATRLKAFYGDGPIGFSGLFFNANHPLAQNPHFRMAMALAVERAGIVEGLPDFEPLTEMLTTNFIGRLHNAEPFNLNNARSELKKVTGWDWSQPLEAEWYAGREVLGAAEQKVVDRLRAQLARLGLQIQFVPSRHATFAPDNTRTLFKLDDRGTAFVDPLIIFSAFEAPAFLAPFYLKDSRELRRLLMRASEAPALDVKAEAVRELSRLFDREKVLIPLYQRKTVYWINSEKLLGVPKQVGISFDFSRLQLKGPSERKI